MLHSSLLLLAFYLLFVSSTENYSTTANIKSWIECSICQNVRLEGVIKDCSCAYEVQGSFNRNFYLSLIQLTLLLSTKDVNLAIKSFYVPLLKNITESSFFRYFRVDLDGKCPFWQDEGSCMLESCSVCAADESELPRTWLEHAVSNDQGSVDVDEQHDLPSSFGWVSHSQNPFGFDSDDALGRLMANSVQSATASIETDIT